MIMALAPFLAPLGNILGRVIDNVFPDPEAATKAKLEAMAMLQTTSLTELQAARDVIVAEAESDGWLARNWRPITMLTFVSLVVARWLGWTVPGITEALEYKLFSIIELGIGGYVVGRSVEKTAEKVAPLFKK